MADERVFPDVSFIDTDTNSIVNEMVADYEEAFGRTLAPADPIYQLILWNASIISQERSLVNIAIKRNLPRYAEGEYLDSDSEFFYGISRQEATPATATFRFSVEEPLDEAVLIPEGTEITTDGTIVFATTEEAEIPAGGTYVDVDAECQTPGIDGNGYAVGAINNLMSDIPFVETVENITVSANGTEEESDDELYTRGRESYEGFTTEGTIGAYKYLVKAYNAAVVDVVARELEPGQSGITFLLAGGVPSEAAVRDMQEYLESDEIRGLTDHPIVSAPTPVPYTIELTYYGAERPAPGGRELRELVEEAVQSYIEWQGEKLGRRINPGKLAAAIYKIGADRVEIVSPAAERTLEKTECAVLSGTPILTYGGVDE
jgi:phage-related baseplate assembly protein